jgi:hypothetical protein
MMSAPSVRIVTVFTCAAAMGLISCSSSKPSTAAGTADFYWSAAAETYAAGDYVKTADHLERLINNNNPYTARAIPWYLVVTSGMSRGYMDLADRYALGARINKADALQFRRKAQNYRKAASGLAMRFAQQVDQLQNIPLGQVPLGFAFPKGNAGEPALLSRIGAGMELTAGEQERAEAIAVERGVLMTACLAAGSDRDVAKARETFAAGTTRAAFGEAVAKLLKSEAALYSRDKLDEPEKAAIFEERAERARVEAAKVGSARIGLLVSAAPAQ